MSDEREGFLEALREDPYDVATRRIFSDWLDDHDEPESADYQRNWDKGEYGEAMEFLELAAEEFSTSDYEGYQTETYSVEEVIDYMKKFLDKNGEGRTLCLGFDTPDVAYQTDKLWNAYFAVTGDLRAKEKDHGMFVRCAC